ncbi:lytic transglycosylase domain-containing protein, partial [Myxococcota bacterium]|nr:lytic transglycosylase domain-containing protein [Myxococcota bacterium]
NIGPIARLAYSWRWRRYAKSPDEKRKLRQLYPASYAKIITRAARKSRVAPALAIALTRQESGFRPDAVSASGALGLMQLMPQTATLLLRENKRRTKVSKEIILNPETNAKLGTTYLGRMLRAFRGNVEYALAAYNAGPGSVTKWRQARGEMPSDIFVEEIPFSETRTYVKRVLAGRRAWHLSRRTKPETIALAE